MYVNHGIMGDENSMLDSSMKIRAMAGNLVASGEAEKMIIVFTAMYTSKTSDVCSGITLEETKKYDGCAQTLKSIIGTDPSPLLRLPYLAVNDTVKSTLSNVPMITCSIDTGDWNSTTKDQMVNKIKSAMADGSLDGYIVLAHETYDTTAEFVEELCPYLKSQGWQVVSISEIFAVKGSKLNGGQVYTKS